MMSEVQKQIIVAIPNPPFAEALKRSFEARGVHVIDVVVVLEHLVEALAQNEAKRISVDGVVLSTDLSKKIDDKRLELLSDTLLGIREKFSHVQFVVLANQREGHPLLAEFINMGIYNVFIKDQKQSSLDISKLIDSIENPLPFSEVSKFRNIDTSIPWRRIYQGGTSIQIQVDRVSQPSQPEPIVKEVIKEVIKTEKVIVEKEKLKEKIVEIQIPKYLALPSRLVSVVSLYPQVGTTFLLDNLTAFLSEKKLPIGLIESPGPRSVWYELLDGDHTAPKAWKPWFKQIVEKGFVEKGSEWEKNNVYYIPNGNEDTEITENDALKLLYLTKQIPILFIDISHNIGTPFSDTALKQADEIWLVVSGDPIQINIQLEKVMSYLSNYINNKNVFLIGNKWHDSYDEYLSKDILRERAGLDLLTAIPDVSDMNASAMWEGVKVIQTKKGRELLKPPFMTMIERILPNEIVKEFGTGKSNWFSFFGK